ncbi:MAG: hypothetical protein PHN52_08140 [candidate division Zixibacteria bacterium]|nr:hypothetical protein [candidate division Zixibacteria bacterium]
MQISFWKEPEPVSGDMADLESLRRQYIADGRLIAKTLSRDNTVLAVGLSGPLDAQRVQPSSDLHLVVLINKTSHIYYHHHLPSSSRVGRRLEIAYLPYAYLASITTQGYTSWFDVFDIHKLTDMVILYEKDDSLNALKEKIKDLTPKQIFIGRQLSFLRHDFEQLNRQLHRGYYRDSLITARQLVLACLKIFLVAGKRKTFSKIVHLYRALSILSEQTATIGWDKIHPPNDLDEAKAARLVIETNKLLKNLFRWKIKCDSVSG